MRYSTLLLRLLCALVVVASLLISASTYADVPKLINFQGRLTDASGKFVPDGNYSVTFRLYNDSTGGSSKWSESQLVLVTKGLFNVTLGSVTPIPDSIFEYSDAFLGTQVAVDPEMSPRQRLTSSGFAYYAKNSDKLDGLHASDFTSLSSDYGRSGVTSDLYEAATTLSDKYVNVAGPDSVSSSSTLGFMGKASTGSGSLVQGIYGYGNNTSSGGAAGGAFSTSVNGTGPNWGVLGEAGGSSSAAAIGVEGDGVGTSTGDVTGVLGYAQNSSSGNVYGGSFQASSGGSGAHYGVYGSGFGSSSVSTFGVTGFGSNGSNGTVYGGYFSTGTIGTAAHYGVSGTASGASSALCIGSYGWASNSSSGAIYGGYFSNSSSGTGPHYGSYSGGQGSSSSPVYGNYGDVSNNSTGRAYGGYFLAASSGTGQHYGIRTVSYGSSDSNTYGCDAFARNSSTGDAYGGYFTADSFGTGYHYGFRAEGYGRSSLLTYGIYGLAQNTSSGNAYAGTFYVGSSGTGSHQAVNATAYGSSSSTTFGVSSIAGNSSTGNVYAGYFWAQDGGSGTKYGVVSYVSSPGYAGYFNGNTVTTGSKSAAVKVENGEYRLLYAVESPENWFEDFGEAQLVNGRAVVQIDPLFAQAVNTSIKYLVYLTPEDEPLTLAVANRTATSFEVRGPAGSNIFFAYRIIAKRKGYEDLRMAKMVGSTPEEIQAEQEERMAESEKERARMEKGRREPAEQERLKESPQPPQVETVQEVRQERPLTGTR